MSDCVHKDAKRLEAINNAQDALDKVLVLANELVKDFGFETEDASEITVLNFADYHRELGIKFFILLDYCRKAADTLEKY